MDTNPGIVALPNDMHLGTTDPFPWDTSKGLYVMNSCHSLHCLVLLSLFYDFQHGANLLSKGFMDMLETAILVPTKHRL